MAHFLTVIPFLIIGMYIGGMFFVMIRFFSPSLNEPSNQRLRNFMLWMLGVGPLLLCIGFSLKLLFQPSIFFWLVIPVLMSLLGGLYFAFKKQNQAPLGERSPQQPRQHQPQPKEAREEEQEQGPMRM